MAEKTQRLKLGPGSWLTDEFDPSVEGVPALTHDKAGVEVPVGKVDDVKAAARANGLTVNEVKESDS